MGHAVHRDPAADLDKAWVVSPGIEGFIMFMVLALAGWF
jgi:hypothetical protein